MDKKTLSVGITALAVVGIAILAAMALSKPVEFRGTMYGEPYPSAPEIDLTGFKLSDQRGKIVLLFFGYTSCPDVCPTTLAELNQALSQIEQKDRVQVVFISVDPERDTLESTQEYVGRFNPAFIGLSGAQVELEKVWADYGVFRENVQSDSAMGYIVNHTARVTLIDADGNMRLSYGFDAPVEDLVNDLKILLNE